MRHLYRTRGRPWRVAGAAPVPGVVKDKRSATEEFDRENILAMEYLKGICARLNIPVD
jgi:hypothetical protein